MIITNYLFPLSSPVSFLPKYGFCFDNARTSEEINQIEQKLKAQVPDGKSLLSMFEFEAKGPDPFSLNTVIEGVFKHFPENNSYVTKFINDYRNNDPFNTFARMWVLVKINENKLSEVKQLYDSGEQSVQLKKLHVEPFDPLSFLQGKLFEFVQLSSLITCRSNYWDYETFLMSHSPFKPARNFGGVLFAYCLMACFPPKATEGMRVMSWFHEDIDILIRIFNNIETELNGDDSELIEYLANLIYTSANHALTEKARLLLLVSVIELLLTYSPDYSRFNIEDSISKQFQLKTSLVVYQNNKNKDINQIRENLRNIYHVRSKIAHGDFKSLKHFIQKKLSIREYRHDIEDLYLLELNESLYMYIKAIIEEYFKDKKYITFIKKN